MPYVLATALLTVVHSVVSCIVVTTVFSTVTAVVAVIYAAVVVTLLTLPAALQLDIRKWYVEIRLWLTIKFVRKCRVVVAPNFLAIKIDGSWETSLARFLILLINNNCSKCWSSCLSNTCIF
jgi:hypothetical protein